MLDMATDTMRAQLLRLAGYRTDVVEFVSTEHTPRNLLIRAVRIPPGSRSRAVDAHLWDEYDAFKHVWGGNAVTPHLEELLRDVLPQPPSQTVM